MKVCVVIGSPRKGDSFNVCREVEKEISTYESNIEFEYIFLNQYNIKECRGCSLCFVKNEKYCPAKDDDINLIKEKLLNCDGIIFASPVYAYNITAQMKKFIDRMSYLFHRQELVEKPALIVVTTDGGGSSTVYKYLKMTLAGWGMDVIGNVQIISPLYFKDRNLENVFQYNKKYYEKNHNKVVSISSKLYSRIKSSKRKIPTFYDIFIFNCLRSKTYTSSADRSYWNEKGWIDGDYFYDAHICFLKKIFGRVMKIIIDCMGRKYIQEKN